jgi:hypothetical protein
VSECYQHIDMYSDTKMYKELDTSKFVLGLKCEVSVPDHDGGRPKQINAWFLYTHMVYL